VATVIDVPFLEFGDERVTATSASNESLVAVAALSAPVWRTALKYRLHLIKEYHVDKRLVDALEYLTGLLNLDDTGIEAAIEND